MRGELLRLTEKEGLPLLVPQKAPRGLLLCFTTRLGGVSPPPFSSLNLSFAVGDKLENVLENRRRLARALRFRVRDFVAARQVHGTGWAVVSKVDRGKGARSLEDAIPEADALLTAEPNVPLLLTFADCAPVAVYDPEEKALAALHVGWKGALFGVVLQAVEAMAWELRARPERCLAFILPRIGPSHLELSPEITKEFAQRWPGSADCEGRVSLTRAILSQLLQAGLRREKVHLSRLCTFCARRLLFSERKERPTGRMALVAAIVER